MRISILGNSGSGKSTLARCLASHSGAPVLDLDTVAWVAGQIAVAREPADAENEVRTYCRAHTDWIIEGCYANLIRASFGYHPKLVFLNPGKESCCNHCRARPWEPHKYPSKEEQDQRLAFLLTWVGEYYTRTGDMSLEGHRAVFEEYPGPKIELTTVPEFNAPSPEILSL